MQKYKSNITTTSGAAVRNVPVHVLAEDGSPAAIFLDRAGTVPASNPLITAADGTFYFYTVNGRYSLRTTVDGVTITDDDVVLMMDPAEITVAGPIAEAVAAAQAAATAAEFAVEASGVPELVAAAQNAVVDANTALAQAIASSNSAALSKTDADAARDAAVTAKMAAEAALDSFDDRYLGAKAVAPTVDNDGAALLIGALYWDTAIQAMRAWNGSAWVTLQAATAAAISNTPAGSIAATTVQSAIDELDAEKAPLSSPALTGTPTAPTADPGTNTTQIATTEYARAAAIAFGGIKAYATSAEAAIAATLLPDGADVEVSQDETRAGARTRYKVQGGALVFVVNLDQTRLDLANATDPAKGAALVALDGRTVLDVIGGGALNLSAVAVPGSKITPTVNPTPGNLSGTTFYTATYVTAVGETEVNALSDGVSPANQQVNLANIPVSADPAVIARRIYRTKVGGADVVLGHLVTTINDNVTTTYTDNIADAALGAPGPRINTTGGVLYKNGLRIASTDGNTTAFGQNTMPAGTGYANTAFGTNVMTANTTGYRNCAFGIFSLYSNTTGARNSAFGVHALNDSIVGNDCTAIGYAALMKGNAAGNTATGSAALTETTTGGSNTAMGWSAGQLNTTGSNNTAVGAVALCSNATGIQNTAIGSEASKNTTGNFSVAVGFQAGKGTSGGGNTVVGAYALSGGVVASNCVAIGFQAGSKETGSDKLYVSNKGFADEATERNSSLLYGVFGSGAADQELRINAKVGFNGVSAQGKAVVNGAATDAATTMALVNQIRAALVANGICI